MKKVLTSFVILFCMGTSHAQNWKPKYSVSNFLDLSIHGYLDWNKNNPWAIADSLMLPSKYNFSHMGMVVQSTSEVGNVLTVETTGFSFVFYKSSTTKHIEVFQKIVPAPPDTVRKVLEILFLGNNDSPISGIDFTGHQFTSGRFYFKKPMLLK